jgi:hypothetical protein
MPFEGHADTLVNVGRGKIGTAASLKHGVLGLTAEDKLKLSKSGVRDLLEGIMLRNRSKQKMPTMEELLRIGTGAENESIFLNRQKSVQAAAKSLNPDIERLTQAVIDAANGKPLKTSITAEREKERAAQGFLRQFILRAMTEGTEKKQEETTEKKE